MNSSANMRCNRIQCNTRDRFYFKELIGIYWPKNTKENDNDFWSFLDKARHMKQTASKKRLKEVTRKKASQMPLLGMP